MQLLFSKKNIATLLYLYQKIFQTKNLINLIEVADSAANGYIKMSGYFFIQDLLGNIKISIRGYMEIFKVLKWRMHTQG